MMKILFLALCFAVVALAQTPPNITSDFSADAVVIESRGGKHKEKYDGRVWDDYTNKRSRVDAEATHEAKYRIEFLRLYDTHDEYFIRVEDHKRNCTHHDLNRTMIPAFAWVQSGSKRQGECHYEGASGILWTKKNKDFEGYLCVSRQDDADPFWVEIKDLKNDDYRRVEFKKFNPGPPDAAIFHVPKECDS